MKTRPFAFPPVADTETWPEIKWASGDLTVVFRDYRGETHHVQFIDVPHFELLQDGELDSTKFYYDGAEVLDSPLIARLAELGGIGAVESAAYQHLVIGFNEVGAFLVVVCRDLNFSGDGGGRQPKG